MATFKGTLFFQDAASSYGWTEDYPVEAAGIGDAAALINALIPLRQDVLTDLHNIVAGRLSDAAILNDSQLVAGLPVPGLVVATIATQADPWSALMIRTEATSLYRGRKYFHGLLEATFTVGRVYDAGNALAAEWIALFDWIQANCKLRHIIAGNPVFDAITNVIPQREVNKKVGRPFNLLRGRRTTTA